MIQETAYNPTGFHVKTTSSGPTLYFGKTPIRSWLGVSHKRDAVDLCDRLNMEQSFLAA